MDEIITAVDIIEGVESSNIDQQLESWQKMVDTGLVWKLQGWYARTADQLIKAGLIRES
jgi:hypothetical protein